MPIAGALLLLARWASATLAAPWLFGTAAAGFFGAQFIGHAVEGRRPSIIPCEACSPPRCSWASR